MATIKRFEDTEIWQHAIKLSKCVYILTREFPNSEQFGLTSQIKRAVNSISANFAEGFGRYSMKDKHHFYTIAYGSLLEVKNFLYLSEELEFCNRNEINDLLDKVEELQKQLNGLMRALRA